MLHFRDVSLPVISENSFFFLHNLLHSSICWICLIFYFSLDCKLCLREILFLKKQKKKRLFNLEPYCNYEDIWMIGLYFILKWNFGIFKQRLCVHVFGCVNNKSTLQGSRIWWDFKLKLLFFFFFSWKSVCPAKLQNAFQMSRVRLLWGKAVVATTRDKLEAIESL